jgi:hypothetical protein
MTEAEKKYATVRIPEDTKATLESLAEKSGIAQGAIVAYLVDQCVKWNMIDPENPDWTDRVRSEIRAEIDATDGGDDRVRTAVTIAEHRAVLAAKSAIFKRHLDDMPVDARRDYTARMLGIKADPSNPMAYLENVSSLQYFKINGVRAFHKAGQDGRPILVGVDPENLVACASGLHVKGAYCQCPLWRTCKWRIEDLKAKELEASKPTEYERRRLASDMEKARKEREEEKTN